MLYVIKIGNKIETNLEKYNMFIVRGYYEMKIDIKLFIDIGDSIIIEVIIVLRGSSFLICIEQVCKVAAMWSSCSIMRA